MVTPKPLRVRIIAMVASKRHGSDATRSHTASTLIDPRSNANAACTGWHWMNSYRRWQGAPPNLPWTQSSTQTHSVAAVLLEDILSLLPLTFGRAWRKLIDLEKKISDLIPTCRRASCHHRVKSNLTIFEVHRQALTLEPPQRICDENEGCSWIFMVIFCLTRSLECQWICWKINKNPNILINLIIPHTQKNSWNTATSPNQWPFKISPNITLHCSGSR